MLLRSENRDERLGPFENKAPNPLFARALAGTTAVRRNLFRNPIPVAYAGISAARLSLTDPGGFARGAVNDTNITSNAQRIGPMPSTAVNGALAAPYRTYTMSAEVRTERPHDYRFNALVWDGSAMSSLAGGVAIFAGAGTEWVRVWKTVTTGAGAQRIGFEVGMADTNPRVLGETFDIRNILIEERPGLLPFFFGGSSAGDLGVAYSWDAAANSSDSIARAGVAEVWRNYHRNPGGRNVTGQTEFSTWVGQGTNTATSTYGADAPWAKSGKSVRITWNTVDSPSTGDIAPVVSQATPDTVFTVEYDIVSSRTGNISSNPAYAGQGVVTTIARSHVATSTITAGVPQHRWATFTADALAISAGAVRIPNSLYDKVPGDYLEVSNIVLYPGPKRATDVWFDGYNTNDADLTPAWVGAPDASHSVLYAVRADGTSGNAQTQIVWAWATNTVRSLPTTTSQDTAVRYNGEFNGFQFGMLPGRTYTIMTRVRVLAAQTNPAGLARRIVTYYWNGANHVAATSAAAPNVPGVYELRYVWTVPPTASQSFVRLYDGGAVADTGKIAFDRMQIVEGSYDGPFFTGDDRACSWRGAAHASASVGYPALV